MNSIRQALLKNSNIIQNPLRLIPRQFSAVVNNAASQSANEAEDDKLYKVVELELRAHEPAVLRSSAKFAIITGNNFGLDCKSWTLRKPTKERYTVLKSVHIYKKHMVQYETRTYYTFVQYKNLTGSTADTLLEYVERNLPEGVSLKATKVELQRLPDHLRSPDLQQQISN